MAYSAIATCRPIFSTRPAARADKKGAAEPAKARPHVSTAKENQNAMKTTHGTMEMTGNEYRAALVRLGFPQGAAANDAGLSEAARFFGVTARASRKWGRTQPPNRSICA
jgi:hypothetical protein